MQPRLLARNSVLFIKEARRVVPYNEKGRGLQQIRDNSEHKYHTNCKLQQSICNVM